MMNKQKHYYYDDNCCYSSLCLKLLGFKMFYIGLLDCGLIANNCRNYLHHHVRSVRMQEDVDYRVVSLDSGLLIS